MQTDKHDHIGFSFLWLPCLHSWVNKLGGEGIFTNSWKKCFNSPELSNTDCTDESIENVPKDIFETPYNDIELSSNPYKCGCNMAWFITRLRLKDFTQNILDLDEIRCHTPRRLKGKQINRLKESDVCPQGTAPIVNECKLGRHKCHKYAQCWDRKYGYDCICRSGFTGDGRQCTDIDECQLTEQCDENSECMNTLGTYSCVCNQGYVKRKFDCEDIDECQEGAAICHRDAVCKNTPGNYQCTCKRGYHGKNGQDCVLKDITSCGSSPSPCRGVGEECIDGYFLGEYKCRCQAGFSRSKSGLCQDIDECKTKIEPCGSTAECVNTKGSYKCVCSKGLVYHGRTCVDIDECAKDLDDCHSDAICVNNIGSFFCVCDTGFKELKEGRLCVQEDEDEGFNMILIIMAVVVLAIASFAFVFYMRKIRNRKEAIGKKPLVKGKQKKNWFSSLMFPATDGDRVQVSESVLTVWSSDSDEE